MILGFNFPDTLLAKIAAAIGERQIFPWQTISILISRRPRSLSRIEKSGTGEGYRKRSRFSE
jgi:hypothetical protein